MKTTVVTNFKTNTLYTFHNDLPPVENLITVLMLEEMKIFVRFDHEVEADEFRKKVIEGEKTLAIGDWCVLKEGE